MTWEVEVTGHFETEEAAKILLSKMEDTCSRFGELQESRLEDLDDPTEENQALRGNEPQSNETCGANYSTGGFDPYGSSCHLPPHHPNLPHQGPNPFGGPGHMEWEGGGLCAGDPLPYRNVKFHEEDAEHTDDSP